MAKLGLIDSKGSRRRWPADCVWPVPVVPDEGVVWDLELAYSMDLDAEGEELLWVRAYYDDLVDEGILKEDYTLNEHYLENWDSDSEECEYPPEFFPAYDDDDKEYLEFFPDIGEDYWFDGFDIEMWEDDLNERINMLKLDPGNCDPVPEITEIIKYSFTNENLLRQAFTRRAFAVEYGLSGCSEELEFIGDSVLNAVVTREIAEQLGNVEAESTGAPYETKYDEGDFTRIRSGFVSKEHLAARASETGLDRFILYGSGEEATESSREDMIEAVIGAVAIDSGWDWDTIGAVTDELICIQLSQPGLLLKKTFYEVFNAWHQKHWGRIPEYEVTGRGEYWCTIRFMVPENDKGIDREHSIEVRGMSRSDARELAAELAYRYVTFNGLWTDLRNAELVPDLINSINQLQELYQKKYVEEQPVYMFEEWPGDTWQCRCVCGEFFGYGHGPSKTAAKKRAAYMVLIRLYESAGICVEEWKEKLDY